MTIIRTYAAHNTADVTLPPHATKPTATTEGMTESGQSVWANDRIDTGLWECNAGSFTATREGYSEICTILSGRVTLEVEGLENEEFGPGDIMVMPSGWKGIWHVTEPLRKHYTTVQD